MQLARRHSRCQEAAAAAAAECIHGCANAPHVFVFVISAGVLLEELVPHLLTGTAYLDIHASAEGAMLRLYGAAPGPDGKYSTEYVEDQVMKLLSVLAQSLFRQQPATMSAFGAAFWGPLVQQYEAAFLQQIQGSSVAVLQARQDAARNMEQQAVSMGLAEPGRGCLQPWSARTVCMWPVF